MLPKLGDRAINVAVIEDGAVIRAENDEGVLRKAVFREGFRDLADTPVELEDGVTTQAGSRFPLKALMWNAGHVDVVGSEEEEERAVFVLFDIKLRLLDPFVAKILITETSCVASGVKADARHAVVDGIVVAVSPIHFQFRAVIDAVRVIRVGRFATYP